MLFTLVFGISFAFSLDLSSSEPVGLLSFYQFLSSAGGGVCVSLDDSVTAIV